MAFVAFDERKDFMEKICADIVDEYWHPLDTEALISQGRDKGCLSLLLWRGYRRCIDRL